MSDSLYFDTARMGRITPTAQQALCEFFRFSGDQGSTNDFDSLLLEGWDSWPTRLKFQYPLLRVWPGLQALKQKLKATAQAHPHSRVLLANRSSQLMRFVAQLLFGPCQNVLITDCTWPNYEQILRKHLGHGGRRLTKSSIREQTLTGRLSKSDLVTQLADAYLESRCDGLFLPAVDNFGIALPVKDIVESISARAEIRFVAVDGAQAFCQIPIELTQDYCDFFFTGCHKWLGAFQPMGLGFYGHRRSAGYIETRLGQALKHGRIDDPLLAFSERLLRGKACAFSETVNLASLFSCAGALADYGGKKSISSRERNFTQCLEAIPDEHCTKLLPAEEFRASVLLILAKAGRRASFSSGEIRKRLAQRGIFASCYDSGVIRLAMPSTLLGKASLSAFRRAMGQALSPPADEYTSAAS